MKNACGFKLHVAPDHVWLEFTPMAGPRAIIHLEAVVQALEHVLPPKTREGILAWCEEARLLEQYETHWEEDPLDMG